MKTKKWAALAVCMIVALSLGACSTVRTASGTDYIETPPASSEEPADNGGQAAGPDAAYETLRQAVLSRYTAEQQALAAKLEEDTAAAKAAAEERLAATEYDALLAQYTEKKQAYETLYANFYASDAYASAQAKVRQAAAAFNALEEGDEGYEEARAALAAAWDEVTRLSDEVERQAAAVQSEAEALAGDINAIVAEIDAGLFQELAALKRQYLSDLAALSARMENELALLLRAFSEQ